MRASISVFTWGISIHCAIGATPATMWMQWRMLQQEQPQDFVIATGRQVSVRRFIELTSEELGWGSILWQGSGIHEVGRRAHTGALAVRIDPR